MKGKTTDFKNIQGTLAINKDRRTQLSEDRHNIIFLYLLNNP